MATLSWKEVATQKNVRPHLPLSGHSAAPLPASHPQDVIIFGGYSETEDKVRVARNEAWTFSLEKGAWSLVKYAPGDIPRERLASQAVAVGGKLWVMGGWDPGSKRDGGTILKDVWQLDLSSYKWTQVHPEGEEFPAISRFQAQAVGTKIYIHTHRSLQDILVLDVSSPDKPTLARVPTSADPSAGSPSSRGLHSMTAVGDSLYLFGGAPKSGSMLNDLWALRLPGMQWEKLSPKGTTPHQRCSQAAAAVGDRIFFYGGSYYKEDGSGLQPLDDLVILDTEKLSWEYPQIEGARPSARNAAVMAAVGGVLVLQGGWDPFKVTYNDTFVLDT